MNTSSFQIVFIERGYGILFLEVIHNLDIYGSGQSALSDPAVTSDGRQDDLQGPFQTQSIFPLVLREAF